MGDVRRAPADEAVSVRKRGSLANGKLADLAVLSRDYLTVPMDEIGGIVSLLTMVGGRVVYAAEPYAALEDKAPGN